MTERKYSRRFFKSRGLNYWTCFLQLIFFLMIFISQRVSADDVFADLSGSAASYNFTQAERKYFIDAPDRFQKYEISDEFRSRSAIQWLDNNHIVFSAQKLPGWEAKSDEPLRIISLNVVTGKFTDSGYRGKLICLNHLGDMMVRRGQPEHYHSSRGENFQWLVGKWGSELTPTPWLPSSFIPNFTCKFAPIGDRIHYIDPNRFSNDLHRDFPLLPEHGFLRETVKFIDGKETHPVHLIRPGEAPKLVAHRMPTNSIFFFLPWLNAYFEQSTIHASPKILYPSGEISVLSQAKLLQYWATSSPPPYIDISMKGILTKAGLLWDVHQTYKFWRKQGLYLETTEGLIRIEEGQGVDAIVSPDGCRVMDSIARKNLFLNPGKRDIFMIIDVCQVKK